MNNNELFLSLCRECYESEILKKLVFSRPRASEIQKASARLVSHKGETVIAFEYSLPGNTVSHKNFKKGEVDGELAALISEYKQANLITTLGDVELKVGKSGNTALLGYDKLNRKLNSESTSFEKSIESFDNKKNYMIPANSDFLIKLGISDKSGRVHDKKQGKYRQITRFVEIINDIYDRLPREGDITVYDLCCGKSYLSFAVYFYLTAQKKRRVRMLGVDLKRDVIAWCNKTSAELGFVGMQFVCDDVNNVSLGGRADMVISLHACDIATDIVINRAAELNAGVVLSTPCCHRYLNDRLDSASLAPFAKYPHLRNKLCEALTDSIRAARLEAFGYDVQVLELTDPDDTPKNTLIKAIKRDSPRPNAKENYELLLDFVLGQNKANYLKEIKK